MLLFVISLSCSLQDQTLISFEVNSGSYDRLDCPVSIQLVEINEGDFQLVEIVGNSKKKIAKYHIFNIYQFISLLARF